MKSKQLLERILKELPRDSALNTARFHITRAINEIEKVEKRAVRKPQMTPLDRWQLDLSSATLINPAIAHKSIAAIDKLIALEQSKLDQSEAPKQQPKTQNQTENPKELFFS